MKPIKGWMDWGQAKWILKLGNNVGILATEINQVEYYKDQIPVIILPLADYDQMIRDHEAQLREAAFRLAELGDCKYVVPVPGSQQVKRSTFANWLKYLKSIKAVTK